MGFAADVMRVVRPLANRIANMAKRAIVERVDDSEGVQLVQASLLEDEVQDRVEHLQPYGLSFNVPAGAEGLSIAVQGEGSNRVLLCASKRGDRPTGAGPGEGGLYSLGAWRVFADEDGNLYLNSAKDEADDALALAGVVDERLDALESKVNDLITKYNTHTHVAPMGGTTPPAVTETSLSPGSSTASPTIKVKS